MAKHAKHARVDDAELTQPSDTPDASENFDIPAKPEVSVHHKKSRRMRIVLIVVTLVLVALMAALGYFAWMLVNEANDVAYQSATQASQNEKADEGVVNDANTSASALKETPELVELIGKTEEEAIDAIGRGATETSSKEITQETGEGEEKTTEVVGHTVTLALTDETTDARGNTPSVYLTLDADGLITEAGYSASVSSLGYGEVSFVDAVNEQHIVENLVTMAGVAVQKGSIDMPSVDDYRTYADDGTTIAQEQYTFTGTGAGDDGSEYSWSCKLSYDYSSANVSGNLSDTIRQVYLYIDAVEPAE